MFQIPVIIPGDTVTVLAGERKGDCGKVTSVDRRRRARYEAYGHHVTFPDGSTAVFESKTVRDDIDPHPDGREEKSIPLDLEKVVEAKPAKEKAPAKPTAAKPKEETRHAREA